MGEPAHPAPELASARKIKVQAAASDGAVAGLALLLQIERDTRRARSLDELIFLIANETRRATSARQVFVLRGVARPALAMVSSVSVIERQAPMSRWIESAALALVPRLRDAGDPPLHCELCGGESEIGALFPFPKALAKLVKSPMGDEIGMIICVRESEFGEPDGIVLQRLAETYGHAWAALGGGVRRSFVKHVHSRRLALGVGVCLVLAGFIPVPLSALATAEVAPLEPAVIAAPIDGTLDQIAVEPNTSVNVGEVVFRYIDTEPRGALDVAAREVASAEARLRQSQQMSFVDPTAKRDLATAQSDLRLKRAEYDYARAVFERTIVRAPRDGVAVFADKREFIGRPVTTGQRIMEIAEPSRRLFHFDVPVDDAVILEEGAKARVFMDSDPLHPISAVVTRAAPMPRVADSGALTFRADATTPEGEMPPLGHRGTAQISGRTVSLAFLLFRRPIAMIRQRTGL